MTHNHNKQCSRFIFHVSSASGIRDSSRFRLRYSTDPDETRRLLLRQSSNLPSIHLHHLKVGRPVVAPRAPQLLRPVSAVFFKATVHNEDLAHFVENYTQKAESHPLSPGLTLQATLRRGITHATQQTLGHHSIPTITQLRLVQRLNP